MGTGTLEQRAVSVLREGQERVDMLRAADVAMEEINWLWPGWLARGPASGRISRPSPNPGRVTAGSSRRWTTRHALPS